MWYSDVKVHPSLSKANNTDGTAAEKINNAIRWKITNKNICFVKDSSNNYSSLQSGVNFLVLHHIRMNLNICGHFWWLTTGPQHALPILVTNQDRESMLRIP